MHDIPLNDTQRVFAEKNHNLVYKFLHEKNLPASEYYDIVIFGYLRAVQRYLTDPNLAGYSFATVAWRAMEGEVANTRRTDKRRVRVIRFVRPRGCTRRGRRQRGRLRFRTGSRSGARNGCDDGYVEGRAHR